MNILIDTHIILWILADSKKLKKKEKEALLDRRNMIICSSISFFEISLKYSLNKLELKGITPEEIPDLMKDNGYIVKESDCNIYASLHKLPRDQHKDPFDRLLIWEAINNDYLFMSQDKSFLSYKEYGLRLF